MKKGDVKYNAYVQILKEELVPAMGCTEPIALAYAAAKAREVLGSIPQKVFVEASGSIIKNVKSVIVPNTGHLKGIPAAVAAGIIAGKADKVLEVIADVTPEDIINIREYLENTNIKVRHSESGVTFEIVITVIAEESYVKIRIVNYHTNIVLIEKDGEIIHRIPVLGESEEGLTDRSVLNLEDILDFANTVEIADVKKVLERQIVCNMAISEEGLRGDYGANIGSVMLDAYGDGIMNRAKAKAAAGSDARMNGCELPVIINSGSGNQGMTTSIPVIEYARELQVGEEKTLRALALSNLVTIHQKTGIGRLSAFCGAVSAGAGAGAGIAYLLDGSYEAIATTVSNALGNVAGIVCDGAKASCAAKIASAVEAGILGYNMYKQGQRLCGGDGIIGEDIEKTITNVGRLGRYGMKHTNEEIIKIMVGR